MAAGANKIRAGSAYVELGVRDRIGVGLSKALVRLRAFRAAVGKIGGEMRAMGRSVALVGAAMSVPFAASVKSFATLEDAMARIRASANPTANEMARIAASVDELSKGSATGPAEIAGVFEELLKAGLRVEDVVGGAAKATLEFARVGGLGASEAAVVMADAMNVFSKEGLTAAQVVDTLSGAADASSIGIYNMTQAFSQASAAFGMTNQRLSDLSTAVAILGSAGIKGSDAGTSLRTMMLRLTGSVGQANKVLTEFGIQTRDSAGNMRPLRDLIGELQTKLGGLDKVSRDNALYDLFGSDAIRAGSILMTEGVQGWDQMTGAMAKSLPVAEKFNILIDTIGGDMLALRAATIRLANAIGKALDKPLRMVTQNFTAIVNGAREWVAQNQALVMGMAAAAVGVASLGVGMIGLGGALKVASVSLVPLAVGLKVAKVALAALLSPIGLVSAGLVAGASAYLYYSGEGARAFTFLRGVFADLADSARKTFGGIADAMATGDIALAAEVLWKGLRVAWLTGIAALKTAWANFKTFMVATAVGMVASILEISVKTNAMLMKGWIEVSGFFERIWAKSVAALGSVWDGFVGGVLSAWAEAERFLRKSFNHIKGTLKDSFDVEAANKQVDVDIDTRKQLRASAEIERQGKREEERQKRLADAEADRQAAQRRADLGRQAMLDAILKAEMALVGAVEEGSADDIARATKDLEAAKKALSEASAKAADSALNARIDAALDSFFAEGGPGKGGGPPTDSEGVPGEGAEAASKESKVQIGGQNAEFTLGGPGLNAQQETAKNTKLTASLLSTIARDRGLNQGAREREGFFSDRVTALAGQLATVVPTALASLSDRGGRVTTPGGDSEGLAKLLREGNDLTKQLVNSARNGGTRYA